MDNSADASTTFRRSPPGIRFQNRYFRHRAHVNRRSIAARVASLVLGGVLTVLGVALLVLPGPGILCLAMAGALFASESLPIARGLDWMELRGRAVWRRMRGKSPAPDHHQY